MVVSAKTAVTIAACVILQQNSYARQICSIAFASFARKKKKKKMVTIMSFKTFIFIRSLFTEITRLQQLQIADDEIVPSFVASNVHTSDVCLKFPHQNPLELGLECRRKVELRNIWVCLGALPQNDHRQNC